MFFRLKIRLFYFFILYKMTKLKQILSYLFSLPNMIAISIASLLWFAFKILEYIVDYICELVEILKSNNSDINIFTWNLQRITETSAGLVFFSLLVIFVLSQWANAKNKKLTWRSSIIVLWLFVWISYLVLPYTEFFVEYQIDSFWTFCNAVGRYLYDYFF